MCPSKQANGNGNKVLLDTATLTTATTVTTGNPSDRQEMTLKGGSVARDTCIEDVATGTSTRCCSITPP